MQADVYDAPTAIPEPASFDLVFTTWGTISWLPDVARWARVVAHFPRPGGGALHFADAHPAAYVFDDMAGVDRRGLESYAYARIAQGPLGAMQPEPASRGSPPDKSGAVTGCPGAA